MSGTVSTPVFLKDGQYVDFEVNTVSVTLGQIVMITADGKVDPATTAGNAAAIGVAVTANRVSRTATDDLVNTGDRVTVLMRGVANVTAGGNVTYGVKVQAVDTGKVIDATAYNLVLGRALTSGTSTATVQVYINP